MRGGRPQLNQALSFEVELGPRGKKRAKNVELIRAARPTKARAQASPAQWGTASLFAIPAFLLVYLGGWPGAIVAQQVLRHKSSKASFRAAFWGTVLLNVAAFIAFNSPLGAALLRA